MRKYVVGFLVGLLVASTLPVYGAISSMVGKEVKVEYPVIVDGKSLDVKAIAIDGVSYSPNRALTDALNLGIGFENKTIYITSNPDIEDESEQGGEPVMDQSIEEQIRLLKKEIREANDEIFKILTNHGGLDKPLSAEDQKRVDELMSYGATAQKQIETLKAALEAQATPTP